MKNVINMVPTSTPEIHERMEELRRRDEERKVRKAALEKEAAEGNVFAEISLKNLWDERNRDLLESMELVTKMFRG